MCPYLKVCETKTIKLLKVTMGIEPYAAEEESERKLIVQENASIQPKKGRACQDWRDRKAIIGVRATPGRVLDTCAAAGV
jgi:hypothetical protein